MAKSKKSTKPSLWWKPELEGDIHEGVIGRTSSSEKGVSVQVGTLLVGLSYQIVKALRSAKVREGKSKIKLEYIGRSKPTKQGRKAKLFNIWIDGKKIETSDFPTMSLEDGLKEAEERLKEKNKK